MNYILELIGDNKEWLFSGVGIAVVSFVVNCFRKNNRGNKSNNQSSFLNIGSKIMQVNGNYNDDGKDTK